MNKRLVYVLAPSLNATTEQLSFRLEGCGMLFDQDINGISLEPLPQYQFETKTNLSETYAKLAKDLHIGFVWQKIPHTDPETDITLIYERLLFIDYETETPRMDYPSFNNQGVYYELGEVIPYICIDQTRKKAMLYSDNDYQAQQVEEVLLNISDPKYATSEYRELFASQINPYLQWFANEEKKYHFSYTHQSYSHALFMQIAEWNERISAWQKKLTIEDEAANAQEEFEMLLQKQANRINYEITRALTANPKDLRTITGFEEQLQDLRKKIRSIFHEFPPMLTSPTDKLDDIITDINPDDGTENAMALQDLLAFILNMQNYGSEEKDADLFLNNFVKNELTILQAYKIFNISINYFTWNLYYAKVPSSNPKQLDSYDRNLIAFGSRMLIICLAFIITASIKNNKTV